MIVICFLANMIGSFALSLVVAVMDGFEHETHKKLRSIHPELIIQSTGKALAFPAIEKVFLSEQPFNRLAGYAPSSIAHVIVRSNVIQDDDMLVMQLESLDPRYAPKAQPICQKISHDVPDALDRLDNQTIIVGRKWAERYGLSIGSSINIGYIDQSNNNILQEYAVTIGGYVTTGINEYDMNMIFCSRELFDELFPTIGVQQIHCALQSSDDLPTVQRALQSRLGLEVYSWHDLYPALVAALKLEKYVMIVILALITLVASMNLFSLLSMISYHKQRDIALLALMGMPEQSIRSIFVMIGLIISGLSGAIGIAAALLTGWALKLYPCIQLPDSYYVSHLPITIDLKTQLMVALIIAGISMVASWLAAMSSSSVSIVKILKGER